MPYIIPKGDVISSPISSTGPWAPSSPSRVARKHSSDDCASHMPLKPALKMCRSHSSGDHTAVYLSSPKAPSPRDARQRANSAPVFAQCCAEDSDTTIPLPSPTKTVSWPSDETSLKRVRTFRKHSKPIQVSHPADDTETETEGESSSTLSGYRHEPSFGFGSFTSGPCDRTRYPKSTSPLASLKPLVTSLPISPPPAAVRLRAGPTPSTSHSTLSGLATETRQFYEVDEHVSSPIPSRHFDSSSNVHLESLRCASATALQTSLEGTVLVRNMSYSKEVTCRFTLDEWSTTSNVNATYVETLPSFPLSYFPPQNRPPTTGDAAGLLSLVRQTGSSEWDRFMFTINVDHGVYALSNRTLWMAVRFSIEGGEWWDNNEGQNYKVEFRLHEQRVMVEPSKVLASEEASGDGSRGASSPPSSGSRSSRTLGHQGSAFGKENWGSRNASSPPVSHTSHSLLPIKPRGSSSPWIQSFSAHAPLAYPTSAPTLGQERPPPRRFKKMENWYVEKQQVPSVNASLSIACRVSA